ncbi:hypothetical protein CR513_54462, partial [Mucuna pruriens]
MDLDNKDENNRTLKELATPNVWNKDLKEFHVICSTMTPHEILEDYIKMKAFPFSLNRAVKEWFSPSLEDLVKQMATSNIQFQQNVSATIQDLQTHIGQLATTLNQLYSNGFGQIPS